MPARTLPNVGLTGGFLPGESGWGDSMSLNLLAMSVLTQGTVISKVAATPGSPAVGDIYLFTEAHPTHPNAVAVYDGAALDEEWNYFAPKEGWLLFNKAADYYERFDGATWAQFVTGGGDTGGIPEAPADGKLYGRKDEDWAVVPSSGGGGGDFPEAPLDGKRYARQNAEWAALPDEQKGPVRPHKYWRFRGTRRIGPYDMLCEIQWLDDTGNVIPNIGSSPDAAQVFDLDPSTIAQVGIATYNFTTPVGVAGITNRGNPQQEWVDRNPIDFSIDFSDDGIAWSQSWAVVQDSLIPRGEVRTFMNPNPVRDPAVTYTEEAPKNGKRYARSNGGWVEVTSEGGGGGGSINEPPDPTLFTLVGLNGGAAPTLALDDAGMHIRGSDSGASIAYINIPDGDFQFDIGVAADTAYTNNSVPRWGVYNSQSNDAYAGTIYFEAPAIQIRRFNISSGGYNSDRKQPSASNRQYWRFKRAGGQVYCYGSKDGIDFVLVDSPNGNTFDRLLLGISNGQYPCAFCVYHFVKSW